MVRIANAQTVAETASLLDRARAGLPTKTDRGRKQKVRVQVVMETFLRLLIALVSGAS